MLGPGATSRGICSIRPGPTSRGICLPLGPLGREPLPGGLAFPADPGTASRGFASFGPGGASDPGMLPRGSLPWAGTASRGHLSFLDREMHPGGFSSLGPGMLLEGVHFPGLGVASRGVGSFRGSASLARNLLPGEFAFPGRAGDLWGMQAPPGRPPGWNRSGKAKGTPADQCWAFLGREESR